MSIRLGLSFVYVAAGAASAFAQTTTMESVNAAGLWGAGDQYASSYVYFPLLSSDGRYICFSSADSNLVANDAGFSLDLFVRDRTNGAIECVTVGPVSGAPAGGLYLTRPFCSQDARFVVFTNSNPLVLGDTNDKDDVFVRDRVLGMTERISVGTAGVQGDDDALGGVCSDDGRWVVFGSSATNFGLGDNPLMLDIFLRDRVAGTTAYLSYNYLGTASNGGSYPTDITPDGVWVAFVSSSSDLLFGDTNGKQDAFVRNTQTGAIECVSVDSSGAEGNADIFEPSISNDGSWVAFYTKASDLVPGDTNAAYDVFLRDRISGTTERVSVGPFGVEGDGLSWTACLSADARFVAFASEATNLVPGDGNGVMDVFLHDRFDFTTTRVSLGWAGQQADAYSMSPAISDDGRCVAFRSDASNITPSDRSAGDVYVRDAEFSALPIAIYCSAKQNSAGCRSKICVSGAPRLTGPDAFFLWAYDVLPQKSGLLFWGASPNAAPFLGGTLCVKPPLVRTGVLATVSFIGPWSCDAAYSFQFRQSYMASHAVSAGDTLYAQFWSRDPGFAPPNNVGLTDAIQFTVTN